MMSTTDEASVESVAELYRDCTAPMPSAGRTTRRGAVTGVDVRTLRSGSEVIVDTCHSRYRIVVIDPGGAKVQVQGGRCFETETEARLEGSTLGGTLLRIGWIGVDLFLEISVRGRRICTSRVRWVTVTD